MKGAISDYDKPIRLNPNAILVLINRGTVRRALGRFDSALADFSKAISLDPTGVEFAEASYNQGVVFQFKGDLLDAVKAYQQAISAASYHVMARTALMNVLRRLGKNAEADEQEILARNLITRDTDYNRARFEATCGNTDKALEHLKIGLEKKQATKAWAQRDPDFENLRDDPRFKALVE